MSLKSTIKKLPDYLKATDSYDVRRYLAIFAMAGGAISFTGLLAWLIFLLQAHPGFLFWIALGCLAMIALMQTGFVALLAKRSIIITKEGLTVNDDQRVD